MIENGVLIVYALCVFKYCSDNNTDLSKHDKYTTMSNTNIRSELYVLLITFLLIFIYEV